MDWILIGYFILAAFCLGFVTGVKFATWVIRKNFKDMAERMNNKIEEIKSRAKK